MPSSYTPILRLTLPATGELTGVWGTTVNNGITSLIESSISGTASITMTDADYTLTVANGTTDESRSMFVTLTGTLTAARNVICPAVSKLYFVHNNTTGGYAITFKTSAGTGISVPNGTRMVLHCNGTDVVDSVTSFSSLSLATPLGVSSGGTGGTTASAARTNLGGTTVGANFFTLTNPSSITFPRINADNSVSALDAATFRTAIGAGTGGGDVTAASANAFTGANTFYNTTGQTFGTGTSTQDGIIIAGRAGGSASYRVTLAPGTLTASRAVTLPDAAGAIVLDGATQTLTSKTVTGLKETKSAISASDIDITVGNYFTKTISGTTTFTVSNVPTTGTAAAFILDLTNGGSATVNWWSGMKWAGGTAPTLTTSGRDVLGFFTHDGGTTWNGLMLAKDIK